MSAGGSPEQRGPARPVARAGWQRAVDPRLLRQAQAARGYLVVTVLLGLAGALLILAQAGLLAHALATAAHGTGTAALAGTLLALLAVLLGRALVTGGGEAAALRAATAVKSQLRRALAGHALRLGPGWLAGQPPGELAALATRGLDGLEPYFARYLPQQPRVDRPLPASPRAGPGRRLVLPAPASAHAMDSVDSRLPARRRRCRPRRPGGTPALPPTCP